MSLATDRLIVDLASASFGTVDRVSLVAAGVHPDAIDRRVGGLLVVVARGVYVVGEATASGLLAATQLSVPDSAAADRTAARMLGFPLRGDRVIRIVVPASARRSFPEPIRIRRTRHLPDADVVEVDRLRCTTVERTICDLAAFVPATRVRRLIEWAIADRRMTAQSFRATARAYCRRGRRGSAVIQILRHELLDGQPLPASELERLGQELFDRNGFTGYVMQFTPPWSDGERGRVDFAWPTKKLIVELDGRRWHMVTEAQQDDRRRDRRANAAGWMVLRFGWEEVVERPAELVAQLGRFLR